jgi:hypothetical protein
LLPSPNPTTTGPSNTISPSKSRPTSSQTRRPNGLRSSRTGSQQISTANAILPTDPKQTNSLWNAVQYHVHKQAVPVRRGKNKGEGPANSTGSNVLQQGPHEEPGTECPPYRTRSTGQKRKFQDLPGEDFIPLESASKISARTPATTTTKRIKTNVAPRDVDFRDCVLEPRGITINADAKPRPNPWAHFASDRTAETKYKELKELENLNIWLETDSDFLRKTANEYDCMVRNRLCEAEFASFGKEQLLKGEPRYHEFPEDRKYRPERIIELVAKPGTAANWREPPTLSPNAGPQRYRFDIRPDCAYWLSLQAFNEDWRDRVDDHVLVMYDRVTCPYFTIEFKRDDSGEDAAENQVAVAGAIALYNRFLLRLTHLQEGKKEKDVSEIACLRHYGATFAGSTYVLWCIVPNLGEDMSWKGCTMSRIFRGRCHRKAGLRSLIHWLNEIHAWGLTEYGMACQRDVKGCIRASGVRTSNVGRAGDEDDGDDKNENGENDEHDESDEDDEG